MSQCRFRPQIPIDFQPFISILESPERILSSLYPPYCIPAAFMASRTAALPRSFAVFNGFLRAGADARRTVGVFILVYRISQVDARHALRAHESQSRQLGWRLSLVYAAQNKSTASVFCTEAVLFTSLPQPAVCLRPPVFRAAQRQVLPAERALSSGKNGCPWH